MHISQFTPQNDDIYHEVNKINGPLKKYSLKCIFPMKIKSDIFKILFKDYCQPNYLFNKV